MLQPRDSFPSTIRSITVATRLLQSQRSGKGGGGGQTCRLGRAPNTTQSHFNTITCVHTFRQKVDFYDMPFLVMSSTTTLCIFAGITTNVVFYVQGLTRQRNSITRARPAIVKNLELHHDNPPGHGATLLKGICCKIRRGARRAPRWVIKVKKVLDFNRHLSIALLNEETGLSVGSVHTIVTADLAITNVCAKVVTKVFSEEQKLSPM